uniref:Uncharacterized protein n=2 Tax=Helianthus annuus TaxID=4232 RepID=A0A251US96_HELAN
MVTSVKFETTMAVYGILRGKVEEMIAIGLNDCITLSHMSLVLPIVMRGYFMSDFNLVPKLVLNAKQSLRNGAAGTKRLEPWGTLAKLGFSIGGGTPNARFSWRKATSAMEKMNQPRALETN